MRYTVSHPKGVIPPKRKVPTPGDQRAEAPREKGTSALSFRQRVFRITRGGISVSSDNERQPKPAILRRNRNTVHTALIRLLPLPLSHIQ
jgi:hypothetical protein